MKKILAALLLLAPVPAHAAQRVWITEFVAQTTVQVGALPLAQLPAWQKKPPLDITGGTAKTLTLDPKTKYIRIVCEAQCAFSTTGTATANDIMVPAKVPEYFAVTGTGGVLNVSVIAVQ